MLPTEKMAVLFTDNFYGEDYHIMLPGGEVIRRVLVTDRRSNPRNFEELYVWMNKLGVNRLWVYPDTMLSLWVMRSDFESIQHAPYNQVLRWSSPETMIDGHPKGLKMYYKGDTSRYIFFPAHIDMSKQHQFSKQHTGQWVLPASEHLYNSVVYCERSTDSMLLWSPSYSSKMILRELHKTKEIVPFEENTLFQQAYRKMVTRPTWVARRIEDKQRGLTDEQASYLYIHGVDKNMQYLGACVSNTLPNERDCLDVGGEAYSKNALGFWEYTIEDVANSPFNSYTCYCPLDLKRTWASTSVIQLALDSGIKLKIKNGLLFDRDTASRYLDSWAHTIYNAREALNDKLQYPDTIASENAQGSIKKYYIDMIGQFCGEYSDEYYHRDWNTLIVHEAIARQGYTLLSRPALFGKVVLVVNDALYLVSDEPDIYKAYPTLLKHEHKLQGYKPIGTCKLDSTIKELFSDTHVSPVDVEMSIKQNMRRYATI